MDNVEEDWVHPGSLSLIVSWPVDHFSSSETGTLEKSSSSMDVPAFWAAPPGDEAEMPVFVVVDAAGGTDVLVVAPLSAVDVEDVEGGTTAE